VSNTVSLQRVIEHARKIYADIDPQARQRAAELNTTCTKGCAACCYQLVACSLAEAFIIADELLRTRSAHQLKRILAQLDNQCELLRQNDARLATFLKQRPCALLDVDKENPFKGFCSVYESRPLACRLQYVTSDPRLCQPDEIYECTIMDTVELQIQAMKMITGGNPILSAFGPLQPLLAHALRVGAGVEPLDEDYLNVWQERARGYLEHDAQMQVVLGKKDKYVK
jgi:Fe-S-cluster containining protein